MNISLALYPDFEGLLYSGVHYSRIVDGKIVENLKWDADLVLVLDTQNQEVKLEKSIYEDQALLAFLGERAYRRLSDLRGVQDGWDFGHGKGFDKGVLETLKRLAISGYQIPTNRIRVYPNQAGGIDLIWKDSIARIYILECYADHFGYYSEIDESEGDISLDDIDTLAAVLSLACARI